MLKILSFVLLLTPTGKVSQFLTWAEAIGTHKSIPNTPSVSQQEKIKRFGKECFDKIRVAAKSPLYVSSLYRNPELNKAVQGAKNSDHQILDGIVACDIDQDGRGIKVISNRALFFLIKDNFSYYKLIFEFGDPARGPAWVHVSWSTDPMKNKLKKVYRAVKYGNRTVYLNFSTSGLN